MATSDSPQTGIYKQQHTGRGTTMVFDADGALDLSAGKVTFPTALQGYLDMGPYLWGARNLASAETLASGSSAPTAFWGGLLMPDGQPALKLTASNQQAAYLQWTSGNAAGIKLPPITMPVDFTTAGPLSIALYGEVVGTATAADAIQAITVKAYMGPTGTDVGTTHANFTSTPSFKAISIASGSLTTDTLNLTLVPQTHAARAINLYGGKITYTKKTS